MKAYYAIALTLIASACTFTPQENGMKAGFHPPIIEAHHWHVEDAVLENGTKVCSISSGYNGLTVFLSDLDGDRKTEIKSNRMMQPGATLTVNADDKSFEAYDTFFSPKIALELLASLQRGDKAYLEWSEFSGSSSRERVHIQNIVQLGGFAADVQKCKNFVDAK
jgi:hypothetical protein